MGGGQLRRFLLSGGPFDGGFVVVRMVRIPVDLLELKYVCDIGLFYAALL